MPVDNAIQFAIVREDPAAELTVVDTLLRTDARVLLVASGGCTALTLGALRPSLRLTLLDANPAQLTLVRQKLAALPDLPVGSLERRKGRLGAVDGGYGDVFESSHGLINTD